MKFIKNFKKFLAFVFSFFIFVPNFSPNVHGIKYINILIVGKPEAGKSTLLYRFMKQNFDKPINAEDVPKYEHGKIYACPTDTRIKVAEMNFENEPFDDEYRDYLYQNANIIIHLSNIGNEPPPTKQDVSKWYDEFVGIILKGEQEKKPEVYKEILVGLTSVGGMRRNSFGGFATDTEDRGYRNKWFTPLQVAGDIGYIIFCFNGLDEKLKFDTRSECRELWQFIDRFANSRSILTFDGLSSNGEGSMVDGIYKGLVAMNKWVYSQSVLSHFESFDRDKISLNEKKTAAHNPETTIIDLRNKYRQFLEECPRGLFYRFAINDDEKEFNEFKAFYDFAESYSRETRVLSVEELYNKFCEKCPEFYAYLPETRKRRIEFYKFISESNQNTTETRATSGGSKKK